MDVGTSQVNHGLGPYIMMGLLSMSEVTMKIYHN
jgi:hypothetical protein